MTTATKHDWNAPTTSAPMGNISESFIVAFTTTDNTQPRRGAITNHQAAQPIDITDDGKIIWGDTVLLIENYTNYDSIPGILGCSYKNFDKAIYAQPFGDNDHAYPDRSKATKIYN